MNPDPVLAPVETPRNIKQLRNMRYKYLRKCRISQDALFNIHEIAYDIPGFVRQITTYPDLECVCGLEEIAKELEKLLYLKCPSQLLSYDTTFKLGDFYVSSLIFRHSIFLQKPCIPAFFFIHERKLTETHSRMFKACVKYIPGLKTATCPLVTDREKAILNSICSEMPSVSILHCWNHIFRDINCWCRKHGAPTADIAVYKDDVYQLFQCPNFEEYQKKLDHLRQTWDAVFDNYYMKEIHGDVAKSIGRWMLEKHGVYNPYSGITNNQSESINRYNYTY